MSEPTAPRLIFDVEATPELLAILARDTYRPGEASGITTGGMLCMIGREHDAATGYVRWSLTAQPSPPTPENPA